jgi:hypothetical protein
MVVSLSWKEQLDAKTQRRKVENTGKILIAADHPMGEPETEHNSWFSLRLCAFASKEMRFLGLLLAAVAAFKRDYRAAAMRCNVLRKIRWHGLRRQGDGAER